MEPEIIIRVKLNKEKSGEIWFTYRIWNIEIILILVKSNCHMC